MDNERKRNNKKIIFLVLLMALVLIGGTYAWFTYNHLTDTDIARTTIAEDNLNLYISSEGGDNFKNKNEADIVQISDVNLEWLMPVSTADLKHFMYAPAAKSRQISAFTEDKDGKYYYRGRIYMKAVSTGGDQTGTFDLYLDTTDGCPVVSGSDDYEILNAARLGLLFDGKDPIIMSLSDKHNKSQNNGTETIVNGKSIGEGKVLSYNGTTLTGVNDPAKSYLSYGINLNKDTPVFPENKIMSMELNKIYKVDVLFYLEGCDVDCTEDIGIQDVNIKLNFYGVLN